MKMENAFRRRIFRTAVAAAALILFPAAPLFSATNSLTWLLQQGLFEEEANRNLDAAIASYQSLAAQFDKDRQVASTAIFRLGECYRKLGRTNEAVIQYERIVRDFSDQSALAVLSRQNLAGLGAVASTGGLAPATALSPSARTEQRQLLQEEISLVEKKLADQEQLVSQGVMSHEGLVPLRRDLLGLKRQLAALADETPGADGLAAAEVQVVSLKTQLEQLKALPPERARIAVQQNFPNPVLTKLLQDLADAEQKRVQLETAVSPEHPTYQNAKKLIDTINKQIDQQVEGVILGLQNKLDAAIATEKNLRSQGGAVETASSSAPTELPMTDDEEKEIRRIQELIRNSPDLINSSANGRTPLSLAAGSGQLRVATFLLDHGADVNGKSSGSTALHGATSGGNNAMVELLLSRGADVNSRNGSGGTPLHIAAEAGFRSVAETLINHKADLNALYSHPNPGLGTPLHVAASKGNVELMKLLIERGANVNAKTERGDTALVSAVNSANIHAVETLLAAKANPNLANQSGDTPLGYAADQGRLDALKTLLAAKANPNTTNTDGVTPLSAAAGRGFLEVVKALLPAKADPNGGTLNQPLSAVIEAQRNVVRDRFDKIPLCDALLQSGADPNRIARVRLQTNLEMKDSGNSFGASGIAEISPIQLAVSRKETEVVKILLDQKANPDAIGVRGVPFFYQALTEGGTEMAMAFLDHGADSNARGWNGTALHLAAVTGNRRVVEALLAHKADINARDNEGLTPLDRVNRSLADLGVVGAQRKSLEEVAVLLHEHGALDDLPDFTAIRVTRPGFSQAIVVFRAGTNVVNRFTLLETVYEAYARLSRNAVGGMVAGWEFPDLTRLIVHRPNSKIGGKEQQIKRNLLSATDAVDCAADIPLQFGDTVEIPYREHTLDEPVVGLTPQQGSIGACIKRTINLNVRGQTRELTVQPKPGIRGAATSLSQNIFLGGALQTPDAQSQLLSSSDLRHVKVTRQEPVSGKTRVLVVDVIETRGTPEDLLLQNGDVIEVPEK